MRFVVTGAGGFLGSHLVHFMIVNTSHSVVAVSSQERQAVEVKVLPVDGTLGPVADRLQVAPNSTLLDRELLREGDVVVNCAFPWNRSGAEVARGLDFQRDLFRVVASSGARTFINISSQSVYPTLRDAPASEEAELDLDSPYAVAKYAMELLATATLPPGVLVNVRLGSLIGRGYDVRIVNRFIINALAGEPLAVEGADRMFSYMDVRDACRALTMIGEQGAKRGAPVVNVGTEVQVSLAEIAREAARAAQTSTGTAVLVTTEAAGAAENAVPSYALDCRLASEMYGFEATLGLAKSVDWIANAID